jgi:HEAT repeat protein
LIAAELAGDFTAINDDLAHALMAVLRDGNEPEELRAIAAIAFGAALEAADIEFEEELQGFDDDEMVPISLETFLQIRELLKALQADANVPKLVRRRILEAAVRAPEPWQQNAIQEAYLSGDQDWILTAVFAMRFVNGFEDETVQALQSSDPEIHREAVLAAGEKELDAAWPHVSKLAKDDRTEKDLRIAAIGAIGSIRPEEAQEILFELKDSEDEDIAEAADEALADVLPDAYEDDEDEEDEE